VIDKLISRPDSPLAEVLFFNLRESMQNGGGPACLRNRVVLNPEEEKAVPRRLFFGEELFQELKAWVERHYRESLSLSDFRDPKLTTEIRTALDELTQLLRLGSIYSFQQE
jgi:succinylarginine dihydrolase